MKEETKIIMYDSPEAAQIGEAKGWVSGGFYFGKADDPNAEYRARSHGATHEKCKTCSAVIKVNSYCEACSHRKSVERYQAMPYQEFNPSMLPVSLADGEKYFWDIEDLETHFEDWDEESGGPIPDSIQLVVAVPNPLNKINYEDLAQDMHEDYELPENIVTLITTLNKEIDNLPTQSWLPGKTRTTYFVNS